MRLETTIEALYNQLPPLVVHVLQQMPQSAQLHFRMLPERNSANARPFDIECFRTVTLRDLMLDLPGTFEFKFQLLCNSKPINFAGELIKLSQQQPRHAPSPRKNGPVYRKVLP
jgi:hypothetical protein